MLTRISAAEMAEPQRAAQLQQFRDAVGKVRALPENDVISWTKQVAQHCLNCASNNPQNIHYDWFFPTWHRAYLYFMEQILRSVGGDDSLRLVYWDWENPASRTLPSIYAPPGQSLYWQNRNLGGPTWPLADGAVDVQPLLAIPDFRSFGGTRAQRQPTPAAYSGPHANVHNAFSPGDMANLQYSPRDPVFYAHHGNIDRLWSSWSAIAGHTNPDFGDDRVYFYDATRTWRYVLLNDLTNTEKLGYNYSSLMKTKTAAPSKMQTLARARNRVSFSAQSMESLTDEAPDFLLIENVRNLETLPAEATLFGFFTQNPPVGTDSRTSKAFLGTLSRVLSEGHSHGDAPLSAALDVTGKLGAEAKALSGDVAFFIAPLDAEGKTSTPAIPLVADDLHLLQ
ncbi:MAG: hypothetical protein HC897_15745 [Thermoanaerobaculia bacterium]|nr:hypothetical protein [Thermoanaerobaculia bacterium]